MRAGPRIPYPVYRSTTGETDRDIFGSQRAPGRRRVLEQLRRRWDATQAALLERRFPAEGGMR